jgi:hypothetical protein
MQEGAVLEFSHHSREMKYFPVEELPRTIILRY